MFYSTSSVGPPPRHRHTLLRSHPTDSSQPIRDPLTPSHIQQLPCTSTSHLCLASLSYLHFHHTGHQYTVDQSILCCDSGHLQFSLPVCLPSRALCGLAIITGETCVRVCMCVSRSTCTCDYGCCLWGIPYCGIALEHNVLLRTYRHRYTRKHTQCGGIPPTPHQTLFTLSLH
jgi:hypothetical protein